MAEADVLIANGWRMEKTNPSRLRVGDVVEQQLSFVVVPAQTGKFKMTLILRSIALINGNITDVSQTHPRLHTNKYHGLMTGSDNKKKSYSNKQQNNEDGRYQTQGWIFHGRRRDRASTLPRHDDGPGRVDRDYHGLMELMLYFLSPYFFLFACPHVPFDLS
jgi:hypothetical protein